MLSRAIVIESHDVPERNLVPRLVSQLGSQWRDFYVLCYVKFDLLLKEFCVFITVNCNFWSVQIDKMNLFSRLLTACENPRAVRIGSKLDPGVRRTKCNRKKKPGGY